MDSTAKADQTSAGANSADDMLAQLAGEEIDRLLAEAEAGNPPLGAAPSPPSAPAPTGDSTKPVVDSANSAAAAAPSDAAPNTSSTNVSPSSADIASATSVETNDAIPAREPAPASEQPTSEASPPAPPDADSQREALTANRDNLPDSAQTAGSEPTAKPAPASAEPALASPSAESKPTDPPPAVTDTAAPFPTETPTLISPEALAADDVRPPSFLIRVVDICLAPFESIPDGLRDAMGKVAIVTLVNALAALAYVAFKHRHHH